MTIALDEELPDYKVGGRPGPCPDPECRSTRVAVMEIGHVAKCLDCGMIWSYRKATPEDVAKQKKGSSTWRV